MFFLALALSLPALPVLFFGNSMRENENIFTRVETVGGAQFLVVCVLVLYMCAGVGLLDTQPDLDAVAGMLDKMRALNYQMCTC